MSAKLVLTRKGEWMNRIRRYKVFINGKEVGLIKNDGTEEYELEPGTYTVQCRIDWTSSPVHTVELKEGKNSYIRVSSGMKYFLPLYIMLLAGLLLPLYFQFTKVPVPPVINIIRIILLVPAALYILFYITINRKKYLFIEEDTANPFN